MSRLPNTLTPAEQDLAAIKLGDWTDREFPLGPREKPTRRQIIFKQSVLNEIYTHGRSAPDIEVGYAMAVYNPLIHTERLVRGAFRDALNMARKFIGKTYGDKYLPEKPNFYSSSNKSAQGMSRSSTCPSASMMRMNFNSSFRFQLVSSVSESAGPAQGSIAVGASGAQGAVFLLTTPALTN